MIVKAPYSPFAWTPKCNVMFGRRSREIPPLSCTEVTTRLATNNVILHRKSWLTFHWFYSVRYDPCHDKTCFCHMWTTKAQISLRILISAFVVRCLDSIIPLPAIYPLSFTRSETPKKCFLVTWLIYMAFIQLTRTKISPPISIIIAMVIVTELIVWGWFCTGAHESRQKTPCPTIQFHIQIYKYLDFIYPSELKIKVTTESSTSASCLDCLLYMDNGKLSTRLYVKMDDFNFPVNFPFPSSNIPSCLAYGIYVSQLIRYARACSKYQDFVDRVKLLTTRLFRQGYRKPKWAATWQNQQNECAPSLTRVFAVRSVGS